MTKELAKPIDRFKAVINHPTVQEQFKNAMGKGADLFVASLIDAYASDLQDCEPGPVIREALKAAVLKLTVSKSLGTAYIVPYNKSYKENGEWKKKKVPQFQLGYKGMIQLAQRSGQLKSFNDKVIYEGQVVNEDQVTGDITITGERASDRAIGYFFFMRLINGFEKSIYWTKEQVIKHAEAKSPSYKNKKSAWFTDFDAMALKTVIRRLLSKYAPMSIEFVNVMSQDESEETKKPEDKNIDLEVEELPPKQGEEQSQSAPISEEERDFPDEPAF